MIRVYQFIYILLLILKPLFIRELIIKYYFFYIFKGLKKLNVIFIWKFVNIVKKVLKRKN